MATPLETWVEKQAELMKPKKIYWCDGSEKEAHALVDIGIKQEKINGNPVFQELNQKNWPYAYLHRSHPTDVARTEHLTYVCYPDRETAGPNNNWMPPDEAKEKLTQLSKGCMKDRTMYVLPYTMGHPDSPYSKACVQLTDVTYVAISMRIMTRLGTGVIGKIGASEDFVKGIHSIGDLDPQRRFIMHFPDEHLVWSIGSGYGGNALLGKKCFSLRIASWLGLKEGWLAEHMIIIGIEDPKGKITYIAVAMPSACGKTNLAMLESTLPGYKVWTIGDDIAWMNVGPDGKLYAINPESGFFGVAPGTSLKTNPNMLRTLQGGKFFPTLFTNTALDVDNNEPWWEGMDGVMPANLLDWQGKKFDPLSSKNAAHPNSRFTVSVSQCPNLSKEFDNPKGVPISAILFGGKRTKLTPLVFESFNWQHGVFNAARMGSETTAAAVHAVGQLRRDPMAMLPFCGYNMADYFGHWLNIGSRLTKPPKIFTVNWFKTDEEGRFIWPGFRDNIRVLKWITERLAHEDGNAKESPLGFIPEFKDLDLSGLDFTKENFEKLFEIKTSEWVNEIADVKKFFEQFGTRLPAAMSEELELLKKRLKV
ncbi:MAG: phosphoenolpyruvate carboxykinase (GTP) [Candidatus Omnitrophota bacterium]